MSRRQRLGKAMTLWAFLTIFIILAMLGVLVATNYSKLSGGTCATVGGTYERDGSRFICFITDRENDEEVR